MKNAQFSVDSKSRILKKDIKPYDLLRKTAIIFCRIFFVLLITVIVLLLIFDRFVEFRDTDEDFKAFFSKKNIPAQVGYYTSNGRSLRYLSIGNKQAPASILFIHGAPSSMSYYKPYFSDTSILSKAHLLSIDRPGYGYSGLGEPVTSIETQAKMIRPLLDSLQQVRHPLIIVAASYGTSVACRIAMDYPELIDGLVLIAPALAPGEEKTYAIGYLANNSLIRLVVPRMLISANEEKFSHRGELQKMLPYWNNINMPVIYLQGKNDGLIYPSNAAFARKHLVNAACLDIDMIPNRGHLIAFLEYKRVTKAIQEMLLLAKDFTVAKQMENKKIESTPNGISINP